MSAQRTLHFAIGPVQGFVAQARRTRDLWAGSFLLSWMAGKAMAALPDAATVVRVPAIGQDPLFRAVSGTPLPGDDGQPMIGSLPNQFQARVEESFDPALCQDAALRAWKGLAEAVWDRFIAPVADKAKDGTGDGAGTGRLKKLWDAQIAGFWDIVWVQGPCEEDRRALPTLPADRHWLAMRKAWRSHLPLDERPFGGGDHCQLMGDWLEISGWVRSLPSEAKRQDDFWNALRKALDPDSKRGSLDLAEGERLCAIALVKRLFPCLPEEDLKRTIGWVPGGRHDALRAWPSTRYMAALPWLRRVGGTEAARKFRDHVAADEDLLPYRVAERAVTPTPDTQKKLGALGDMDGSLFYETALLNAGGMILTDAQRSGLVKARAALVRDAKQGEPSPYYAVLLMDGDSVGDLIYDMGPAAVTRAFDVFTRTVKATVEAHDGVCIYAGGDDVLALLPLPRAVPCAAVLRQAYRDAFVQVAGSGDAADSLVPASKRQAFLARSTISAAVILAEATVPLRQVMNMAHQTLDDLAKTTNGRNSIAMKVVKPGGQELDWVSTWDAPRDASGETSPRLHGVDVLVDLARIMAEAEAAGRRDEFVSSRFLYNIRGRYGESLLALLNDADGDDALRTVLTAEYCHNPAVAGQEAAVARDRVDRILAVCRETAAPGHRRAEMKRAPVNQDAGLLLRFLAQAGGAEADS